MEQELLDSQRQTVLADIRRINLDVYEQLMLSNKELPDTNELTKMRNILKGPRRLDDAPTRLSSMKSNKGIRVDLYELIVDHYKTRLNVDEGECRIDLNTGEQVVSIDADLEVVAVIRTILTVGQTSNPTLHQLFKDIFNGAIVQAFKTRDIKFTKERFIELLIDDESNIYSMTVNKALRDSLRGSFTS